MVPNRHTTMVGYPGTAKGSTSPIMLPIWKNAQMIIRHNRFIILSVKEFKVLVNSSALTYFQPIALDGDV